jgi:hypothetical protein
MPDNTQPSFSSGGRWKIGFEMLLRTVLVLAVVVMVNYIGALFFERFYLSSQTRFQLSTRTRSILHTVTNNVMVTLYYDRQDSFYPEMVAMLNEYSVINPKISFKTVDYVRDAGAAEKVKEQYGLKSVKDKNLIIIDAGNGQRPQIIPGDSLIQYGPTGMSKDNKIEFSPVAFKGEVQLTSAFLALQDARPFKAYFLQGQGEPSLSDTGQSGYSKFALVLTNENNIDVQPLQLLGDTDVPDDCNLLIIAGPRGTFKDFELQKIDRYLSQGGRLFALLDSYSIQQPTGLESVLRRWGVNVAPYIVQDMKNTTSSGYDVVISKFGQHPIVNPLMQSELQMILPRPVSAVELKNPPPDAPEVTELAFSSDTSTLMEDPATAPRSYPLMAAVEQKNAAGVANTRGNTRMVITGDSIFLGNLGIEGGQAGANRDFLGYAVNWLLERQTLLEGIGPRPVREFRLMMTKAQLQDVRWILLGVLPGAVLLLGGLVWLARRK